MLRLTIYSIYLLRSSSICWAGGVDLSPDPLQSSPKRSLLADIAVWLYGALPSAISLEPLSSVIAVAPILALQYCGPHQEGKGVSVTRNPLNSWKAPSLTFLLRLSCRERCVIGPCSRGTTKSKKRVPSIQGTWLINYASVPATHPPKSLLR